MQTLKQQQYIRAQKQRKQQLYKMMLDQQVKYNSEYHRNSTSQIYPGNSNDMYSRRNSQQINNVKTKYLPVIEPTNRYKTQVPQIQKYQRQRLNNPEDRTQIYLSNCEDIIKNLRQLKNRKRQKSKSPVLVQNNETKNYPMHRQYPERQREYYPKSSFFSSGSPYNHMSAIQNNPKSSYKIRHVRLKTLDQKQISSKGQTPILKKSKKQKNQKKTVLPKHNTQTNYKTQSDEQYSNGPTGLINKQKIQQTDQFQQKKQQQLNKQNEKLPQKQLINCITQLTNFLKNQNRQKQMQKNKIQKNQKPQISKKIQPEKQNDSIIQVEKQDQSQQNINSIQTNQLQQKQIKKFENLKNNAIKALKKVNQKSHQLLMTMKTKKKHQKMIDTKSKPSKNNQKLSQSPSQILRSQSPKSFKQLYTTQNRRQNSSTQKIQIVLSTPRLDNKNKQESNQLIKQLMHHMSRQQSHNQDLTYCLKQLTQYLKHQNDQIQQLKQSKVSQKLSKQKQKSRSKSKSPTQNSTKKKSISPSTKSPKTSKKLIVKKQLTPQQIQMKNQQSIIKRLKNARVRGNILRQKMQSFRKKHNHAQKPESQTKIPQQQKIVKNQIEQEKPTQIKKQQQIKQN